MKFLYLGLSLHRAKITGIERFARNQIISLAKANKNDEFIVLAKSKPIVDLPENCKIVLIPFLNHFIFYISGKFLKKLLDCSILISPHSFPILFADETDFFTVHDVAWFYYPKLFPKIRGVLLRVLHYLLIKSKASIHCVSESTKIDVFKNYNRSKNVFVSYPGADYAPVEITNESHLSNDTSPYILFLGTYQKRKNIQFIFKCMDELDLNLKFYIVGGPGWYSEDVLKLHDKMRKKDSVKFFGYLSEYDRDVMIKNSLCMVLPSLYEGFGFPVIEGLKYKKVTIAADNSSLMEIVGDKNFLFSLNSVQDFERVLSFVADKKNEIYINNFINEMKKKFTWENFAISYNANFKI